MSKTSKTANKAKNLDAPTPDEEAIARAAEAKSLRKAQHQRDAAAAYHRTHTGRVIDEDNPPSPEPSHGIAPMHTPAPDLNEESDEDDEDSEDDESGSSSGSESSSSEEMSF